MYFNAPAAAADASSAVLDTAIAMVSLFHMIEWMRQTVVLTTALVGVNLIPVYWALSINVVYGFIAMLVGVIVRNTANGKDCAEAQPERARYLQLQILCMFLYIPMMFGQFIFFKVKGTQWL